MRKRLPVRSLLLAGALALLTAGLSAPAAQGHQGWGAHFFCGKLVQPRSYCTGFDGVLWGLDMQKYTEVAYGGSKAIEVCAIVDVFRRSDSAFVHRWKQCGFAKHGQSVLLQTHYTTPFNGGFNPFTHYQFAKVYNRSPYAHTLHGGTIGYAYY